MTEPLLSADDMAARLKISKKSVWRQCRAGSWPHLRVLGQIRFTEAQYAAILALLGEQSPRPAVAPVVDLREVARRKIA